jgi:hypothetical protein
VLPGHQLTGPSEEEEEEKEEEGYRIGTGRMESGILLD